MDRSTASGAPASAPSPGGSAPARRGRPASLAAVLAALEAALRAGDAERRADRSALRSLCALLGEDPAAVPADPLEIDRRLARVPRPVRGRSDRTVANLRWRVRRAIAFAAGTPAPARAALSPDWAALYARLDLPRWRLGLSRLIRAASARGVGPEQVSDALLGVIADELAAVAGEARAWRFRRQACACWNEAAEQVAGWPSTRLRESSGEVRPRRLPASAFPASFQRDLEAYLEWAARAGRLTRDSAPRSLSPATVRLRGEHLRLAASALARRLGYPRRVIGLATLVEPVNFKLILSDYAAPGAGAGRDGRRPGAFVAGLAGTLFGVARQWVKAPVSQLDQLGQFKRRLGARSAGVAERSRRAIEPFADPRALAALLALPAWQFAQAGEGRSLQPRAVRQAQVAVAMALLLAMPLRLRQLAGLRLDRELRRDTTAPGASEASPVLRLDIGPGRGPSPAQAWLAGPAGELIGRYLDRCHAALRPNPEGWLFVRPDGSRVPEASLRHGIATATRRALGVALTPGAFRHLAAALVLRERPGDLALVRGLLAHGDARTTARLYAGFGMPGAAAAYADLLDRARDAG